jgi:hypothetical protein
MELSHADPGALAKQVDARTIDRPDHDDLPNRCAPCIRLRGATCLVQVRPSPPRDAAPLVVGRLAAREEPAQTRPRPGASRG